MSGENALSVFFRFGNFRFLTVFCFRFFSVSRPFSFRFLPWLVASFGLPSLLQEGSLRSPDFLNLTALTSPYENPLKMFHSGTFLSFRSPDRIRAPDWALREVPDPLNQDRFSRLQTVFLPFSGTVFFRFPD